MAKRTTREQQMLSKLRKRKKVNRQFCTKFMRDAHIKKQEFLAYIRIVSELYWIDKMRQEAKIDEEYYKLLDKIQSECDEKNHPKVI